MAKKLLNCKMYISNRNESWP